MKTAPPMSSKRKRLLLVSYLFPPVGGVGVQRAISLVKYLPPLECNVVVLTTKNPAVPTVDPSLLATLPPDTPICRAFTPEFSFEFRQRVLRLLGRGSQPAGNSPYAPLATHPRATTLVGLKKLAVAFFERLMCPDPQRFWVPFAIRAGKKLVKEHTIDAVLVTAPPFSAFQVGVALKRKYPHLKLILDYRDQWIGYIFRSNSNISAYRERRVRELEREAVSLADYVVSVTPTWVQQIRNRYPEQPSGKFLCVPNGYDPGLLTSQHICSQEASPHSKSKMVITYTGSLQDSDVYSPRSLVEALLSLPETVASKLEFRIAGRVAPEALRLLQGCGPVVRLLGFLPQGEAFAHVREADYTLLIVGTPDAQSGKLFEYLAAGKPVLALTPPHGEIARVLNETKAGWCVPQDDPAAITQLLMDAFERWQTAAGQSIIRPDWGAIRQYERPRLVAALAKATGLLGGPR